MIGELISAAAGLWSNNQANAANRKMAQNQIQWRVADAKKAGIHPLAALGANVQPVPSQPLLGDASLGGLASGINKAMSNEQNLNEEEQRSRIRVSDAQARLLEARSRTVAQAARQPLGSTIGGNSHRPGMPIPAGRLGTIQTDPTAASAQTIQDRYGDIAEDVWGLGVVAPHDYAETVYRRRWQRMRRRATEVIRGRQAGRRFRPRYGDDWHYATER